MGIAKSTAAAAAPVPWSFFETRQGILID